VPLFNAEMRAYYRRRATEYDEWWLGTGQHGQEQRPGWHEEVEALIALLRSLPLSRVLDVACGTGFLTQHLTGEQVTALDQSPEMVRIAQTRMPSARVVCGEAVPLPFAVGSFDRLFTSNFYGHLHPNEREAFLTEARRVASHLLVLDAARHPDAPTEAWQNRRLNDGSRHRVFKRYFEPEHLAEELGGGRILHAGRWFVVVET
jgi:SAM-dependent methyltransferase